MLEHGELWGNCGGGDNPGVGHQGPTGPGSGGPSEREREKEDKQENTEQNCAGNPVLIATGTKYQVEHDFTVANSLLGFGRLYFQRSRHEGSLGKIWRTSYDYQLAVQANEIGVKQGLTISTPDGRQQYFYPVAGTQYWLDSNGKLADLLTTESGDWVFKQGEVTFNFNAKGQLIAMSNDNEAINLLYQHGRLAEVVSTTHRSIQFSYHDSGLLSQVTDANGAAYTYDYSHNGLLSQVSFPGGNHKRYFYEDQRHPSALTAIDINDKNYASWQYDEQGRAISSEHADGAERTEFAYLGDLKTTVTNALGKQTTYQFTEINGQKVATEITGHAGNYCSSANQGYEYDDYGRQTSQTDWNGFVTTTAYNERGLITESVLGAGSASTISKQTEWHATLDKPAKVTTAGSITEFSYANNGDLTLKLQTDRLTGEQRQWRYDYAYHDNRMLAKLTIDGPRDDVSDITVTRFDLQGNTLSQTNALGHQVQYGDYDQMGNPGYKVNINGVTTEFDYDARGRMLESRLLTATPAITRYQYNAMGQLIKTTRPKGDSYQYEYDAAYRKISESDAQGQTKRWLLDAAGNALESSITGESHAWQIETCLSSAACLLNATQITEQVDDYRQQRVFDSLSRVVESRESGSLNSRNEYDVQGNLLSTTDASGNQIHFSYDQFNRKIAQTNALGHSSTFAYNAQGQLSTVTDARGNVTEYQYNGFGEKVAQVSPDGGTNQYQYLAGLMISETTANGIVRQYKYDPLNRLSEVSENFQAVFSYVYDSCNYGIGKLCQTQQDDNNHSRYSYQPSGQLFELRSRIDGNEYVQQWQYDLNGNITERYMPSGQRVKSWYNRNNRLSYINYNDQALGWDFDYLAFGPVKAWTSANHLKHGIEYTQQRQVSQIVTSNVQHLQYQYDEVGNISAWFNHAQHFNQSFAYDALGQITSIDNSDGWQDISYDAIGNRLSLTTQTDSDWYRSAFDSNRLLAITGAQQRQFDYDANGNIISEQTAEGAASYQYGRLNRMLSHSKNGQTTHYSYNAKGQR